MFSLVFFFQTHVKLTIFLLYSTKYIDIRTWFEMSFFFNTETSITSLCMEVGFVYVHSLWTLFKGRKTQRIYIIDQSTYITSSVITFLFLYYTIHDIIKPKYYTYTFICVVNQITCTYMVPECAFLQLHFLL